MKKSLLAVVLVAALVSLAAAADTKTLPPMHIGEKIAARAVPGTAAVMQKDWHPATPPASLFFCPKKTCLYYSGDDDTTSSSNNGLFDISNPGIGITQAEVWVGVKPKKASTMKGTSGNYFNTASGIGTNPTPVAVRTKMTEGNGGTLKCNTTGNATFKTYGNANFGLNSDNYYVKKMAKSCKLAKGKVAYVLLNPVYNDGSTIGYLEDTDGAHANKKGFPEDANDAFFNSSSFGVNYGQIQNDGLCGGVGCVGFSISITGTVP